MRLPKALRKNSRLILKTAKVFLDIAIIIAIIINIYIYFANPYKKINIIKNYKQVENRLPPEPTPFTYTDEELNEAIKQLRLPTWSRSYTPCTSPKSEVTCSQIVYAWQTIKQYIDYIDKIPLEEREYIRTNHVSNGVGNRIGMDVAMLLLAMMTNRSVVVEGVFIEAGITTNKSGNAYGYHHPVYNMNSTFSKILSNRAVAELYTFYHWYHNNYYSYRGENTLSPNISIFSDDLCSTSTCHFCHKAFWHACSLFLSNFLIKIPEDKLNYVKKLFKDVPKNVRIFGIHIRFHQPGHFFTYGVEQNMKAMVPFLNDKLRNKPTVFAFSSDSKEMEKEYLKVYKEKTILTNSIKIPDFDHNSALVDILFLMYTNQCLLTFRSTFSYTIMSRMCKRGYYIEKESSEIFQASNSQAGAISMQYHTWDFHDWQTNRRFYMLDKNEECFRYFFNYLVL